MKQVAVLFMTVIALANFSVNISAGPLEDLQPGHWYVAGTNTLEDVSPEPFDSRIRNLIKAWNGGAYDTKRDRFIVLGGGHADYWGNEIYAFDVNTFTWSRLNDPYFPAKDIQIGGSGSVNIYPDGSPASVHTYDGVEYLPEQDALLMVGGSRWIDSSGVNTTAIFNFETLQWRYGEKFPVGVVTSASAYDAANQRVLYWGNSQFAAFDPVTKRWDMLAQQSINAGRNGVFDPINRKFIVVGKTFIVFDLSGGAVTVSELDAIGEAGIVSDGFGLAYDPMIKKIVAWGGGADVYTLDLAVSPARWVKISPAAGNTVIPTPRTRWGTYGRWRYIPSKGVFIGVNETYEQVYFYKMDSGLNISIPSISTGENIDVQ